VHNMNRPEVHDIYREWRRLADTYDAHRVLIGETWVEDVRDMARFYGDGSDELDLALNIPFLFARDIAAWRDVVRRTFAALPTNAWPLWTGSNHDQGRFATHWCDGVESRARAALLMLLTLPGTPILYFGDEIGMTNVSVPHALLRDPVGLRRWPADPGRDPGRTPMQWTSEPGGGFTRGNPWLPLGDTDDRNVADQRADRRSMLHLCRDAIALRRERPDLQGGGYVEVDVGSDVWAWRRGSGTVVVVNGTGAPVRADVGLIGSVAISTVREHDGTGVDGEVQLEAWEAVVVEAP
jgi:alpha-glucosidase